MSNSEFFRMKIGHFGGQDLGSINKEMRVGQKWSNRMRRKSRKRMSAQPTRKS